MKLEEANKILHEYLLKKHNKFFREGSAIVEFAETVHGDNTKDFIEYLSSQLFGIKFDDERIYPIYPPDMDIGKAKIITSLLVSDNETRTPSFAYIGLRKLSDVDIYYPAIECKGEAPEIFYDMPQVRQSAALVVSMALIIRSMS